MFYCTENIDAKKLVAIASQLAVKDHVRILPFMVTKNDNIRVVCPCCLMDKRVDADCLESMIKKDFWSSIFVKEKCKKHKVVFKNNLKLLNLERGFTVRPVSDMLERRKFIVVDTPVFRSLGFKGHKFDRNVFLPIAIYLSDKKHIRLGIPDSCLMDDYPIIQRAAASWIFRLNEELPLDFPDVLPLSVIGNLELSVPSEDRNVYSWDKKIEIGPFFDALIDRSDFKSFRAKKGLLEANP